MSEMKELHVELYERKDTTFMRIVYISTDGERITLADTECDFRILKIVMEDKEVN